MDRKCLALALACATALTGSLPAAAAGFLDDPAPGAAVSGIAVIAGWYCPAARIEMQVDGGTPFRVPSGTDRPDTQSICGRRDTGFGWLLNWGALAPGAHTLRALADGVEFARRDFTVTSLGAEFVQGKSATVEVPDFPEVGKTTVLEWQESMQSFVAREVREEAPDLLGIWNGANLERRTNCASAQNNGQRGTYAQYNIALAGSLFTIAETAVTGLTCTYNGTYTRTGRDRHVTGTYFCSDGKQGNFTTTSFLVTGTEMQIRMDIKLTGSESCTIDAILGGSRF